MKKEKLEKPSKIFIGTLGKGRGIPAEKLIPRNPFLSFYRCPKLFKSNYHKNFKVQKDLSKRFLVLQIPKTGINESFAQKVSDTWYCKCRK